jgi:serine/threonine protein kinase
VYSLGVVLYEFIAGRSPYKGAEHELAARILSGDPLALPEAPRDLDAVARKALRKVPDERYESVKSFQEDINRFLEGLPVLARGNGAGYRGGKFLRKRWRPISLFVSSRSSFATHVRASHGLKTGQALFPEASEGRAFVGFSPDARRPTTAGDVFSSTRTFRQRSPDGQGHPVGHGTAFSNSLSRRMEGSLPSNGRPANYHSLFAIERRGERKLPHSPVGIFHLGADSRSLIVSHRSDRNLPHPRGFDIEKAEWWKIGHAEGRAAIIMRLSAGRKTLCFVRHGTGMAIFSTAADAKLRPPGTARLAQRFRMGF